MLTQGSAQHRFYTQKEVDKLTTTHEKLYTGHQKLTGLWSFCWNLQLTSTMNETTRTTTHQKLNTILISGLLGK